MKNWKKRIHQDKKKLEKILTNKEKNNINKDIFILFSLHTFLFIYEIPATEKFL